MPKLLLFSHSGFSDTDANGITMKNLLSAWKPEEKAEFYCDVQSPDFSAAHHYFRVTDTQAAKAFLGKKSTHIYTYSPEKEEKQTNNREKSPKKIPAWLKKLKYNFVLKWLREYLWKLGPWGHGSLKQWIRELDPDVLVYMVGESLFMDDLVLETCRETGKPLVLYNGEAFRIIDLKTRHGLERMYYRAVQKRYEMLNAQASLVIYNCEMLKSDYEARYAPVGKAMVVYNSAACDHTPYEPGDTVNITYFGNLGVGRCHSLARVAGVLERIDPELRLDVYGNVPPQDADTLNACPNVRCHGFIDAAALHDVVERSDILLHVESFDETIIPKLKYAFSTKIAQCLCAGRCFVSFAPAGTASSRYLAQAEGAVLVSDEDALEQTLRTLVSSAETRQTLARQSLQTGRDHHDMRTTACSVGESIRLCLAEKDV